MVLGGAGAVSAAGVAAREALRMVQVGGGSHQVDLLSRKDGVLQSFAVCKNIR